MSGPVLAEVIGYLASALGVAMVVPQIARTLRDRSLPGVSALSWALIALSCTTWLLYGLRTDEIPQVPGNVLLVSGAVAIVLAVPSTVGVGRRALGLLAGGVAVGALAAFAAPIALAILAFGMGIVSTVPQTVRSFARRGAAVTAVSLPAWLLRIASQLGWLTYSLLISDVMVTVSAVFLITNALLVIFFEFGRRPAAAPAPAACVPATA